jgi:hypothetical protein
VSAEAARRWVLLKRDDVVKHAKHLALALVALPVSTFASCKPLHRLNEGYSKECIDWYQLHSSRPLMTALAEVL